LKASQIQKSPDGLAALVVEYTDPIEGFKGWFVRDTLANRLCAGGVRVQPGLSRNHLCDMARNMTHKMQIANLRVDGAKCGIDYDPQLPGKQKALARFMEAILPYIKDCYSVGPDLNVDMRELDSIGEKLGITSVKIAIATAMGWDTAYFLQRYGILSQQINGWTLSELRAGSGLAQACLTVLEFLNILPSRATAVIQGFGAVSKACAYFLNNSGVRITGFADYQKSIIAPDDDSLDIDRLLLEKSTLLPLVGEMNCKEGTPEAIYEIACDIFIPAAVENAITREVAAKLRTAAVVPGANLAVTPDGESILYDRKIVVLPDFLAGCGGSLSMEGLFGPALPPEPNAVLAHVQKKMASLVAKVLARSRELHISPTEAALQYCDEAVTTGDGKPYVLNV
jgi:glutamate dehydrogenase (NAD(P)+)